MLKLFGQEIGVKLDIKFKFITKAFQMVAKCLTSFRNRLLFPEKKDIGVPLIQVDNLS